MSTSKLRYITALLSVILENCNSLQWNLMRLRLPYVYSPPQSHQYRECDLAFHSKNCWCQSTIHQPELRRHKSCKEVPSYLCTGERDVCNIFYAYRKHRNFIYTSLGNSDTTNNQRWRWDVFAFKCELLYNLNFYRNITF